MHSVVCIKQVPDSAQIRVHPVTNTIMRQGVPTIINPYDLFALEAALRLCPAGCYSVSDLGQVEVVPDGCFECGTCRVLCEPSGEIEWNYPRGGFGVLFKFG